MRVATFHSHTVHRVSPALSGLIIAHSFHSFCFTFPFLLLNFISSFFLPLSSPPSSAWELLLLRIAPNRRSVLWHGIVIFLWFFVEVLRIYWGTNIHRYGHVFNGMGFVFVSIFVQLPLISAYWGASETVTDIFFSICLVQVAGVVIESFLALMWSIRVGRHELINFYIRLGAMQRHAAAGEVPASMLKQLRRREGNGGAEKKKG